MKLDFWFIGKTAFPYLEEGIQLYAKRLQHYAPFEMSVLPDVKNAKSLSSDQLKTREGEAVLKKLHKDDMLLLLDERGKQLDSLAFAGAVEEWSLRPVRRVVFLVGGAYGFSEAVYARADAKLSLSKMTFSHQMVRLFFVEQLYRAFTIIRNEPYHHS
jgi:23S rRNA (pseudouridine1915-N3)-methyltransferase